MTSDQLQFFNSQGYLVIESFSSSKEVEALRKRMDQLLDGFDCSSSASIFSTKNQDMRSDCFGDDIQAYSRSCVSWLKDSLETPTARIFLVLYRKVGTGSMEVMQKLDM
ncbi:hypothetical protein L6452_05182 [Arctium lappa]|uniref:Uncharacterized protein n=1 Tax=Arctium lappa TaxID=4217 RepID=A0ACB9EFC4_ARCLA|nr:hypothetical protein L6452_05182 [Arctium lappa]